MPKLLLHTCCAPCLSSVEEQLRAGYSIDVFWYNPNIYPADEYNRRLDELRRFGGILGREIIVHEEPEDHNNWHSVTVDYANEPEGQRRCGFCIRFRLEKTVQVAARENYDIFTTTLSVSPHKNATVINQIGKELAESYSVPYLEADFKKNDGYLRSVELAKYYGLYRQPYCGCIYSMNETLARALAKKAPAGAGAAAREG